MKTSPCEDCPLRFADKNNINCARCNKRVAYLSQINQDAYSLPLISAKASDGLRSVPFSRLVDLP